MMNDHSEFPWGPQYEPGLLTPLGVVGWVVAVALLLALLILGGSGTLRLGRRDDKAIHEAYDNILAMARYALKQDEFGILAGADDLRRIIRYYFGGLLQAGGGVGKQAKKLGEVMGDGEDEKSKDGHGKDHGGGHGSKVSTVSQNVHGPSITVNVGAGNADDGHGGHSEHGHDDKEKPLTLEQQLAAVRKAVREFEAWWSDKSARISELRGAREDLTAHRKPDRALTAKFGDPNKPEKPNSRPKGLFEAKTAEPKKSFAQLIEEKK